MPYANEHAARVRDPAEFEPESFRRKRIAPGLDIILGRLRGQQTLMVQAYRFDADVWTAERARAWLREHDIKVIEFAEATGGKMDNTGEKRQWDENVGGGVDRDKLQASDFVFGDERVFPVVTPADVSDAVRSWGRYRGPHSFEEFRRRLIALCRRKGTAFVAALPEEWTESRPVKSSGDWVLDVLAVPYGGPRGGKDADGEYFDADTNLHDEEYPTPPLVYYHGMTPEGKPAGTPEYIGRYLKRWRDNAGVWIRYALDKTNQWAKRVWEAAQQGTARCSSGTLVHLRRVDADGHIREWPLAEVSAFDMGEGREPANAYAVAIPAMKAIYEQAGVAMPVDADLKALEKGAGEAREGAGQQSEHNSMEATNMDENELKNLVTKTTAEAVVAALAARDAEAAAKAKAQADFEAAVKAEAEKRLATERRRLPDGAPYVTRYDGVKQFDNWTLEDLASWIPFVNSAIKTGNRLARPLPDSIYQALFLRVQEEGEKSAVGRAGLKALGRCVTPDGMPLTAIKANEVMQYDLAGYGDEWVQILYSDVLWEKIRFGTPVLDKMKPYMLEIQGAETLRLLVEGGDVAWYRVSEAASLPTTEATGIPNATFPTSREGTAKQDLTLGKLGARVLVSGELSASTPIAVVQEVRRNMEVSGREMIENVLINGDTDTTANTNINDIAGTPDAGDPFLVANGFRKLALVTNSANSISGSALDIGDFATALSLMGTSGINAFADPSKCSFILDVNTWVKALSLPELKTQDVYGMDATVRTGQLPAIYGVVPIISAQMHKVTANGAVVANNLKANSAGKIDQDTLTNNTTGAILAVRWDQWRMGYRRMLQFESTRIARADVTELVSLAEIAVIYRDIEAAAEVYNVTL